MHPAAATRTRDRYGRQNADRRREMIKYCWSLRGVFFFVHRFFWKLFRSIIIVKIQALRLKYSPGVLCACVCLIHLAPRTENKLQIMKNRGKWRQQASFSVWLFHFFYFMNSLTILHSFIFIFVVVVVVVVIIIIIFITVTVTNDE